MLDLRTEFTTWYFNEFHLTDLYQSMVETVEGSPWHREANVGIHTDMVVAQYLGRNHNMWDTPTLLGALACAFHDVGKPAACKKNGIKFKPERGNYLSFGGHEILSARMWEDFAVREWVRLMEFGLVVEDIYHVGWMIEHHLPWGVKRIEKRKAIAQTLHDTGLKLAFVDLLLADTWGRISDDGSEKKAKVNQWIVEFFSLMDECESSPERAADDQPILYVPIGAAGTGKSTFRNSLPNLPVFSLDDLRLEWYIDAEEDGEYSLREAYSKAFERACGDNTFNSKANARYMEMIKTGNDLYVDNTNTSAKRRRFYITEARKRGYYIQAIVFPIELQELIDRQTSRPDKTVPVYAIERMYMGLQLPSYGDFDGILVTPSNL